MRRSLLSATPCVVVAIFSVLAGLSACEDGPGQSFSPATGVLFDDGLVDGAVAFTEASYDAGYVNKTVLTPCSPELQRSRWGQMLGNAMMPPVFFAGLDLRGCNGTSDTSCLWPGLSIENATKAPVPDDAGGYGNGPNCQGTALGNGQCGENQNDVCGSVCWGNSNEVCFSYDLATHLIDQMQLTQGYLGRMTFTGPTVDATLADGKTDAGCEAANVPYVAAPHGMPHQYTIQIGYPIQRDGKTLEIDWGGTSSKALAELYDAITFQFDAGAGIAWPGCAPGGCMANQTCLYQGNIPGSVFGARPLATYMIFNPPLPQPTSSEPLEIYVDYAKFVPNSTLDMTLALNQRGPYTNTVPAGAPAGSPPCNQQIGQTYEDYVDNCIEPFPGGTTGLNQQNYGKLVGGRTHNIEEITFNVVGINEDFSLSPNNLGNAPLASGTNLGAYGIVGDSDLPSDGDQSTEWYFDVRAFGVPTNEVSAGAVTFLGSALVQREYQRLVEDDLARLVGLQPSAPESCAWDPFGETGLPTTPTPVDAAHVCTGMEALTYPGSAVFPTDPAGIGSYDDPFGFGVQGAVLKPGDHLVGFIANPYFTSYDYGFLWDETLSWVTRVLGRGNVLNLPPEARDRRYFFRWFGIATIKYLKAFGDVTAAGGDPTDPVVLNPTVVSAEPIDLETLFFDNNDGAQFDKFEYLDLSTIAGYAGNTTAPDPAQPYQVVPFDYEYGSDVKEANQRYTYWFKRLDREEFAMYQALSPVKTDPPAAHANYGVNLTNMAGSSILASIAPTYECAAAQYTNGAYVNGPGVFASAATECPTEMPAGPPGWLLDPVQLDLATPIASSLMDANGQQAENESVAGSSPTIQASYHSVSPAQGGVAPDGSQHTLLWQYPGAFTAVATTPTAIAGGGTVFKLGHSPIQVCPPGSTTCSDPTRKASATSAALEVAQTMIPSFANPWAACVQSVPGTKNAAGCDPTDATYATPLYALVPWLPSQPGIGFEIPINGSSNLFVQTGQLDFTGNLETYTVDYVPYQDVAVAACANASPSAVNGGCEPGYTCRQGACIASDDTVEIRAIEAHDFLGEVFPCQDPSSGDVLHVRMYTSTTTILSWLAAHPGDPANVIGGTPSAQTACNIIIRYSPFDNYPDFITSLAYGVALNTNEGQGFGRIADATIFNPLYETINQ